MPFAGETIIKQVILPYARVIVISLTSYQQKGLSSGAYLHIGGLCKGNCTQIGLLWPLLCHILWSNRCVKTHYKIALFLDICRPPVFGCLQVCIQQVNMKFTILLYLLSIYLRKQTHLYASYKFKFGIVSTVKLWSFVNNCMRIFEDFFFHFKKVNNIYKLNQKIVTFLQKKIIKKYTKMLLNQLCT